VPEKELIKERFTKCASRLYSACWTLFTGVTVPKIVENKSDED
jgi:hypothetical protein